ncbi:hypothetical protein [Stakelama tenebrarum]|uniref:Uncharacterized protein n=1 Tax=Stakelama tenebrarum TaxID=2711215 RepID=A0A6G6Y1J0_9SPHN|nr:hypothetical protein [Sphingosinithalassobacter tenebrarum]QIG78792.1 hypothetical protein G5C33_02630 [Sphingosinithalassobacter tenebrarum]
MIALVAAALALNGCGEDKAPVNRVILPAPLTLEAPRADAAEPLLQKLFWDANTRTALYFDGEAGAITAHFITVRGPVDLSRILSKQQQAALAEDDPAIDASRRANNLLTRTGLPDRAAQLLPAQEGYLVQAGYGRLHYLSYAGFDGATLRLGSAIDMGLLAKLSEAAGLDGAFRSLPEIADPQGGSKPGRLVYFTQVPAGLGDLIADNAGALYRDVSGESHEWTLLGEIAPPAGPADSAGVERVRAAIERGEGELAN